MELVRKEKKLFLIYQAKNESPDSYTRNFKALLETTKESGVAPGKNEATAKLVCTADGGEWSTVTTRAKNRDADSKELVEKYEKEGQE